MKSLDELRQRGFALPELRLDGKVHRFDRNGKRNAWVIGWLHYSSKDGEQIEIVNFGDWKTGEKYEWTSRAKLSAEDRAAVNRRAKEAAREAERERAAAREEAAAMAKDIWDRCTDHGVSPYLAKKQIRSLHGARTEMADQHRNVVVPMWNEKMEIRGLQRIRFDGRKTFLEGQQVKGLFFGFHKKAEPENESDLVYVCEGFATGATIYEATGRSVFVGFQASNLESVALLARKFCPGAKIVICGDDDKMVKRPDGSPWNPGREAAQSAASKVCGTAVFPEFANPDSTGTDFNDLFVEEGLSAVRTQIEGVKQTARAIAVRALGRDANHYFFISSENQVLSQLAKGSMTSPAHLLSLAPLDYWRSLYGENKNGGVDWQLVGSELLKQGNAAGIFSPLRVRGRGVWLDRGRVVVHQGRTLLVDGKVSPISLGDSDYIYEEDVPVTFDFSHQLSANEASQLVDICRALNWRKPAHAILFAGWVALSRVGGSLPWRPHIWVTGDKGSGKTTLRDLVLKPAAGNLRVCPVGETSSAGIRQHVRNAALSILFDEAEAQNERKALMMESVLELARIASSENDDTMLKGSAGGTAQVFRCACMFAMSSIRVALDDPANLSRFAVLELLPGNDMQFQRFMDGLSRLDQSFWDRLAARAAHRLPQLIQDYGVMQRAMAKTASQRFGQQYGMLLTGFYSLTSDEPLSLSVAERIASMMDLDAERDESQEEAAIGCLDVFLDHRVTVDFPTVSSRVEMTISELLEDPRATDEVRLRYGIMVKDSFLWIKTGGGSFPDAVYQKSKSWITGWKDELMRIPGAVKGRQRFLHRFHQATAIGIPMTQIFV